MVNNLYFDIIIIIVIIIHFHDFVFSPWYSKSYIINITTTTIVW